MCLHPQTLLAVPEETARVARAAFPRGNPYLQLRDTFGPLFADPQFAALFPKRGRPAEAPWRLAVVTLLQFAEGLSDRQAADAVRARLDWKYLLGLELTDPGFDHTLLCAFRARLVAGKAESLLFDTLLTRFQEQRLLGARGTQRTDSTHVLAAVRTLNRLELVGETLRHALNTLATVAPAWLQAHADPAWVARYDRPCSEWRLPKSAPQREALAHTIATDGFHLLQAVEAAATDPTWHWLAQVPAVQTLQRVWEQQYTPPGPPDGTAAAACTLRPADALPPAGEVICSPYDPEARFAKKRETRWVGYKLHVTETCAPDQPLVITDVQTSPAGRGDAEALPAIQAALARRRLLPGTQLADAGYVSAGELVRSHTQHQVALVGPTQGNRSWQARQGSGFALADFQIDWEAQCVRCPAGQRSVSWKEHPGRSGPVIQVRFAAQDCQGCAQREQCTRATESGRRLTVLPQAEYAALQAAREQEQTGAGAVAYAIRAGVEGTLSQGVRRSRVRCCRYVGQVKVHWQHLVTAAALNLVRVAEWLLGTPRARTRTSAFARVMAVA